MAWGRHCKVISPQSIKEMVAEEVRAMNSQIEQPTLEK
jgi:predicted DNA-binding transcriptional regulator YafY